MLLRQGVKLAAPLAKNGKLLVSSQQSLPVLCQKLISSLSASQNNLLTSSKTNSLNLLSKEKFHTSIKALVGEGGEYWDYSEKYGPNNWEKVWKATKYQSPVDIVTKNVKYDATLEPFTIDRTPVTLTYQNNGVNAAITPAADAPRILLKGGALGETYEYMQFHFHFGEENTCGCEHTVDGHHYAAELHIVHYNTGLYQNATDGFHGANGLAVLGIFLDAHESYEDNPDLAVVLKEFDNIVYEGQTHTTSEGYSIYDLLPKNIKDFFTYPGSLTTPPLYENVIWTVFKEPIKMSKKQQKEFMKLIAVPHNHDGKPCIHDPFVRSTGETPNPPTVCNNYRPVQPLHDRVIRSSFKI